MSQRSRTITLHQPLGGIHRRTDYQSEQPYTCYDSLDVFPFDAKTSRRRCAVRPGWAAVGSLTNANLLATLHIAPTETARKQFLAASGGTLYKWDGAAFTSVGTGISTGRNVQAVSYLKKLYIANDTTPKVYDWSLGTVASLTATDGSVPSGCRIVSVWNDRLLLAGDPSDPHILYGSAQNLPRNWLIGQDDAGTAFASSETEGGTIREPITALIPHNHNCLIVSGASSMDVFVGNPAKGGTHRAITNVSGIVNPTAWCKTPDDWTYMITRKGLAKMPPGCGDVPQLVSPKKIPESLRAIDGISQVVFMAADVLFDGLHIYVTGGTPEYWWFDLVDEGFWRVTAPGASILGIHRYDPLETSDKSGVMVATAEGVKRLDRTAALGGASLAYLTTNPLRAGGALGGMSMAAATRFAFSANTDDATGTVALYGARDGERAVALPVDRKWSAPIGSMGAHRQHYPRVGGQSLVAKITQGDTSKHWSLEDASLDLEPCGMEG